jgi:hypothetical protein
MPCHAYGGDQAKQPGKKSHGFFDYVDWPALRLCGGENMAWGWAACSEGRPDGPDLAQVRPCRHMTRALAGVAASQASLFPVARKVDGLDHWMDRGAARRGAEAEEHARGRSSLRRYDG